MATSRGPRGCRLRLPKPKTLVGLMSLQTGTEMITLALLINKLTGLYGLLAILTGYALDGVQLSMYTYSVCILVALAYLLPYIRRQSPFHNLLLAWLYIFDTAANTAYTVVFAVEWYVARGGNLASDHTAEQATDTAASMVLIAAFTLVRVYLMLVVMSYARQVLRRYVAALAGDKPDRVVAPFAKSETPEGEGWRGALGRAMVFVGQEYWIGGVEDEEWAAGGYAARLPLAGTVDNDDE